MDKKKERALNIRMIPTSGLQRTRRGRRCGQNQPVPSSVGLLVRNLVKVSSVRHQAEARVLRPHPPRLPDLAQDRSRRRRRHRPGMVRVVFLVEEPEQPSFRARKDPSARVRPEQVLLAGGGDRDRRLQDRRSPDLSLRHSHAEKVHSAILTCHVSLELE